MAINSSEKTCRFVCFWPFTFYPVSIILCPNRSIILGKNDCFSFWRSFRSEYHKGLLAWNFYRLVRAKPRSTFIHLLKKKLLIRRNFPVQIYSSFPICRGIQRDQRKESQSWYILSSQHSDQTIRTRVKS